jgi:phosphoribosylanthranilate isomerase
MTIKAFPAGSQAVSRALDYGADLVMLDAPSPGSGQVFDWRLVDGVPAGARLMLAGGLNPDNVADAIAQSHAWGVDVVTGVESGPGRKDPVKLRSFIAAAKAAAVPRYEGDEIGPYDWQADF